MNAVRYERIDADGLHRPVILRIEADDGFFVIGIEVGMDGEPIKPRGADERRRLIEKAAIIYRKPLAMNRTYGTLE